MKACLKAVFVCIFLDMTCFEISLVCVLLQGQTDEYLLEGIVISRYHDTAGTVTRFY